jgi:hypothetical protein|mmetsp:Transcript_52661/g.86554  ORF Transcript_52661/g.86554 Transcript_52661/m.86554 type:complete len:108 (+) Transcript_52661:447-770(+)
MYIMFFLEVLDVPRVKQGRVPRKGRRACVGKNQQLEVFYAMWPFQPEALGLARSQSSSVAPEGGKKSHGLDRMVRYCAKYWGLIVVPSWLTEEKPSHCLEAELRSLA